MTPAASAAAKARLRAAEIPGAASTRRRTSRPSAAATVAATRGSVPSLSTTTTERRLGQAGAAGGKGREQPRESGRPAVGADRDPEAGERGHGAATRSAARASTAASSRAAASGVAHSV